MPTGASQTLAANGLNQAYSYDSFGNLQEAGNYNFEQQYTSSNQLSGWSYDQAGNLLTDGLGNSYQYDAESKIKSGPGATYSYTAEGQRVEKAVGSTTVDTVYFGGRPIARLSGGAWTDLVYAGGGLLAEVPGTQTGSPVYRVTDHLGSVVETLSSSGAVLGTQDLGPFGETFAGSVSDAFVFTGKERDAESGNDYFGARFYSSNIGRFMTPDWASQAEAVPYSDFSNPQSLNLYAYVSNNPTSRTDADGHLLGLGNSNGWFNWSSWLDWLKTSHSGSASVSAVYASGGARRGGLSVSAKALSADAKASASWGKKTGLSASASAAVGSTTVNEGPHSTTQMSGLAASSSASAGVSLGGSSGVGVSASAGGGVNVLTGSQTETVTVGPLTITATATANVGLSAGASASAGTNGLSASENFTPGYGGAIGLSITWGDISASSGASVKGTIDSTTGKLNSPEITNQ